VRRGKRWARKAWSRAGDKVEGRGLSRRTWRWGGKEDHDMGRSLSSARRKEKGREMASCGETVRAKTKKG
jgi:hypothetical protein